MTSIPKDVYKPENANQGKAGAVLIVTADGVEDLEFFYPYYRFIEAGFTVDVATPKGGKFKGKNGLGLTETMKIADVNPDQYRLLYIPGGKAPAKLKDEEAALQVVKKFATSGKSIAAICHGPQLLAAANVIEGCDIAAWPEVEDEVNQAGAQYINAETVLDGQFITARWPADLPMHMKRTLELLNSSDQSENRAGNPPGQQTKNEAA